MSFSKPASRWSRESVVAREPQAPEKTYWGFDESGSMFRSATPVDNKATSAWHTLVAQAREKMLPPKDAAELISVMPDYVKTMFDCALATWPKLEHWHQWPCAACASSAEQILVHWVSGKASKDPNAWSRECDLAEKRASTPCRFASVASDATKYGLPLSPPSFAGACRTHSEPAVAKNLFDTDAG